MMVYKVRHRLNLSPKNLIYCITDFYQYWDSITKEDLEFSVGIKQNNWEVKDLLPEDERRSTIYQETDYTNSLYQQPLPARTSSYSALNAY